MMEFPARAWMRRRRRDAGDDGFTIVEMMIALAVIALMFTGTALVLGSALSGASETRLKQHAVEVATEILESTRAVDYASVATQNITADIATLTSAGYIAPNALSPGNYTFDPDGSTGPLTAENVILTTSAAIDPVQPIQRNGISFNVWTVVTDPDAASSLRVKRVTTRVSWVQNGRTFARHISTIVTETRRGLPLPNFTVGDDISVSRQTDQALHLPFSIANNGARDNWNIVATSSPSAPWVSDIAWYRDNSPSDGQYSTGEAALTDVSGDGVVDTGLIETDDVRKLVGYIDLAAWALAHPATPVTAGTYVVTISLTSASQPTTPAKSAKLTFALTAPAVACGCTYTDYWFHNATPPSSADSNLVTSAMPATASAPSLTSLPNYDKNKDSIANSGRTVLAGGTDYTENTATKIAQWEYQLPSSTIVKAGTVTVKVWVAMENLAAGTVTLHAYARYSTTGSGTNPLGTGSATTTVSIAAGAWVPVTFTIPVAAAVTIDANKYLRAYVTNAGTGNVWVAYGTTTYNARLTIPKG